MSATPKPPKKRSNTTLILIGVAFVAIIAAALIFKQDDTIEVTVEESAARTLLATVSESGTVQPAVEVKIAPDVSGEIVFLGFAEGDVVKKGDLLVTIRPESYQAAMQQSEASLNSAKAGYLQSKAAVGQSRANYLQDSANFVRNDQLYRDKVISKLEWENANLRYMVSKSQYESALQSVDASFFQMESAKASLSQARQNLSRTNIYATMDGTVTQLNVELGERVVGTMQMAGTEIMRIADLSTMEVTVDINENDIINIRIGDSAKIEIDAFEGKAFQGTVSEIAYSASVEGIGSTDQITNFEVKVQINPSSYLKDAAVMRGLKPNQSPFRPGMSAQVEIYTDRRENVVSVPIQAVTLKKLDEDELEGRDELPEIVFVYESGEVKEIIVKTGISDDKYIEVTEGLSNGQKVVTGPYLTLTKKLEDGKMVEIMDEDGGGKDGKSWEK